MRPKGRARALSSDHPARTTTSSPERWVARQARRAAVAFRRLALAVGACSLAVLVGAPTAAAVAPGQDGPIAFETFIRGGGGGIHVANPDGSLESLVAPGFAPAWSADGQRLAYLQVGSGGSSSLWVQDVYRGTRRRLLTVASASFLDVAWSPTGDRLVFAQAPETNRGQGKSALWTIGAGGGQPRQLTNDGRTDAGNSAPDWSPDGSRIVYAHTDRNISSIETVAADGTGAPTTVETARNNYDPSGPTTLPLFAAPNQPSWSPDGARIAYSARPDPASGLSQILTVNPDGSGRTQLTSVQRQPGAAFPAWAPSGDHVVYEIPHGRGSGVDEIWTINRDGSGAVRVPLAGNAARPAWGSGPLLTQTLAPPPVAGESVTAEVVSGSVFVKCGLRRRLKGAGIVPVGKRGCLVDARQGAVRVTAVADSKTGDTKSGVFSRGQFRVFEKAARRPITELRLAGALSCPGARGASAHATARRRRLFGNAHGRFRTRGRFATASVRGTEWLTEDRCSGTLVRVTEGAVAVRDLRRRRTIIVRSGKRYFAKAR